MLLHTIGSRFRIPIIRFSMVVYLKHLLYYIGYICDFNNFFYFFLYFFILYFISITNSGGFSIFAHPPQGGENAWCALHNRTSSFKCSAYNKVSIFSIWVIYILVFMNSILWFILVINFRVRLSFVGIFYTLVINMDN